MEEQFSTAEYIQLAPDVLVPITWHIYGIEGFVLEAIRRIVATTQQESPIIQVNNIPARLIRNHPLGFPFVWELVQGRLGEGEVYEIDSHIDENNNVLEIPSGSDPESLQTWYAELRELLCILRSRLMTMTLRVQ